VGGADGGAPHHRLSLLTHPLSAAAEAANHTCGDYDTGVDEMALAGLTPEPSVQVTAARAPMPGPLGCV